MSLFRRCQPKGPKYKIDFTKCKTLAELTILLNHIPQVRAVVFASEECEPWFEEIRDFLTAIAPAKK